jgi:predicted dehydrogenase
VEIIGTKGHLELNRPFVAMETGRRLTYFDEGGKAEEIAVPQRYLYQGEIQDMHAAILDGAPNYLTLTETRNHVKTVLSLYESAKTGKKVQL